MEVCGVDRYVHMEIALKEAGLKVEEIARQGKKTVINVSHCKQKSENPVLKSSLQNNQEYNPKTE